MRELSACGCRQCGGARGRDDVLAARRVLAWAPFVRAIHGGIDLANRRVPPTLYSATLTRRIAY